MALENLKKLSGGTAVKEKQPVLSNLSNLSKLTQETTVEKKPEQKPQFFIQKPGPTTDEAMRQKLLLEEQKKVEPWYKKAARVLLPKTLEKKFGLDKLPTPAQELMKSEDEFQARQRQKQFEKILKEEKVVDIFGQSTAKLPEGYKEPGVFGQFVEAVKENYYSSVLPVIGTQAEKLGLNPEMIKWGQETSDRAIATALKRVDLRPPEGMKPYFEGGYADPTWYARSAGGVLTSMGAMVGGAIVGGIIGGPTGATIGGFGSVYTLESANAYRDMIGKGIPADKARVASDIYGVISAVLENIFGYKPIAIGKAFITDSGKKIISTNLKTFLKQELVKVPLKILKKSGEEAGEEALQQLAQNLITKWYNQSQPVLEGVVESAAQAFFGTIPLGAGGLVNLRKLQFQGPAGVKPKEEIIIEKPLTNLKTLAGVPTAEETAKTPTALELQKQIEEGLVKKREEAAKVEAETGEEIPVPKKIIKIIEPITPEEKLLAERQSHIFIELETAEPGERIRTTESNQIEDGGWIGIKSTIPNWIPENLRHIKLIKAVLTHIDKGTVPITADEIRMYNLVSDRMEAQDQAEKEIGEEIDVAKLFGEEPIPEQDLNAIEEQIDQIENEYEDVVSREQVELSKKAKEEIIREEKPVKEEKPEIKIKSVEKQPELFKKKEVKEFEPLAQEARKYKSAEEFESAVLGGKIPETKLKEMGFEIVSNGRIRSPQGMELTDIYNQAVKTAPETGKTTIEGFGTIDFEKGEFEPAPDSEKIKDEKKFVEYEGQKVPIIGTIDSKTGKITYDEEYTEYAKFMQNRADYITSRVINIIQRTVKQKDIKPETIRMILKQSGIKKVEANIVLQVMETEYPGAIEIPKDEFIEKLRQEFLPLSLVRSDSYADYGIDSIDAGGDFDNIEHSETHIYDSPYKHQGRGHFSSDLKEESGLFAHARVWDTQNKEGRIKKLGKDIVFAQEKMKGIKEKKSAEEKEILLLNDKKVINFINKQFKEEVAINIKNNFEKSTKDKNYTGYINDTNSIIINDLKKIGIEYVSSYWFYFNKGKFDNKKTIVALKKNFIAYTEAEIKQQTLTIKSARKEIKMLQERKDTGEKVRYIAELQSDSFQAERVENKINRVEDELTQYKNNLMGIERTIEGIVNAKDEKTLNEILYTQRQIPANEFIIGTRELERILKPKEEIIATFEKKVQITKDLIIKIENNLKNAIETQTPEEKRFFEYKNTWHERIIREEIRQAALDGIDVLRFPMPYTIAQIEGFVNEENKKPYEVVTGNEEELVQGDIINYGGQHMVVVFSDWSNIDVVEKDKVKIINIEDFYGELQENEYNEIFAEIKYLKIKTKKDAQEVIEKGSFDYPLVENVLEWFVESKNKTFDIEDYSERLNDKLSARSGDIELKEYFGADKAYFDNERDPRNAYIVENGAITESFSQPTEYNDSMDRSNFNYENLSTEQATVVRFYDKKIIPYLHKIRDKNIWAFGDKNGNEWAETRIKPEDKDGIEAFKMLGISIPAIRDLAKLTDLVDTYEKRFKPEVKRKRHSIVPDENIKDAYKRVITEIRKEFSEVNKRLYTPAQLAYLEDFVNNVPAETLKNLDFFISGDLNAESPNFESKGKDLTLEGFYRSRGSLPISGGLIGLLLKPGLKFQSGIFHHEFGHHYYEKFLTQEERNLVGQVWDKFKNSEELLKELFGDGNKYEAMRAIDFYGKDGRTMLESEMFSRLFQKYANKEISQRLDAQMNKITGWEQLKLLFQKIMAFLMKTYNTLKAEKVRTNPSLDKIFRDIYKARFTIKDGLVQAGKMKQLKRLKNYEKIVPISISPYFASIKGKEPDRANIGFYRDGTPHEIGNLDKVRPIEFPEIVSIARELMQGDMPTISTRLRTKLGAFYPGRGNIKLNPLLFTKKYAEGNMPAKVLAHEIGHLTDWLPDKEPKINRGNILGRLFTLRKFMKGTYGFPEIKNNKIRDELKRLTQFWNPFDEDKVSKSYKGYRYSSIELYAEAISVLFNDPATLQKMSPDFYNTFFEELDKKPEAKQAYFEAQAILTQNRDVLIQYRREGVRGMFSDADLKAKDIQKMRDEERKWSAKDFWFRLNNDYRTLNYYFQQKINELKKKGIIIPADENPFYILKKRNRVAGIYESIRDFEFKPIHEKLTKEEIDWNSFGEYLFYERVKAGDRSELANPRGITPEAAGELIEAIRAQYGEDKFKVLEQQADRYRNILKKYSKLAVEQEGMYSEDLSDMMDKNDKYAPFRVIEYLEQRVSTRFKHQVGTLKDIENPADTLMIKTLMVVRAIENNKAKRQAAGFIKQYFPEDIKDAKKVFSGKTHVPVESKIAGEHLITFYQDGKMQGIYVEKYIADSLNNNTIEFNNAIFNALSFLQRRIIKPLFVRYNPGWLAFNFARDFLRAWSNMPAKSFGETMTNFIKLSSLYKKSYLPAKIRAFGINKTNEEMSEKELKALEDIKQALESGILSTTYNHLLEGRSEADAEFEKILEKANIGRFQNKKQSIFLMPLLKLMEFISNLGDLSETLPKISGMYYFNEAGANPSEMFNEVVTKWGSPDFFEKGRATPVLNEIFLFSNPIIQAINADIESATQPQTRAGFWWSQAIKAAIPKLLMLAMLLGLMGERTKKKMESASEYDRTNYFIVPICFDQRGKAVYIRVPTDETSRLIGGLMWKAISSTQNKQSFAKDAGDMFNFFGGQLPSPSPILETAVSVGIMATGGNPYDTFRNQPVLTDQQKLAGGWYAWKPYLFWIYQQLGGNIFMKLYNFDSVPKESGTTQKIFEAPIIGNILGRFVKVSNYGVKEELMQIKEGLEQKQARQQIDEKMILNDVLDKWRKDPNRGLKKSKYARLYAESVIPKPKSKEDVNRMKALEKRFMIATIKQQDDPRVAALLIANTTEEKVAILQEIKNNSSQSEWVKLRDFLLSEKVISIGVLIKIK
jgi:hypothetical protein